MFTLFLASIELAAHNYLVSASLHWGCPCQGHQWYPRCQRSTTPIPASFSCSFNSGLFLWPLSPWLLKDLSSESLPTTLRALQYLTHIGSYPHCYLYVNEPTNCISSSDLFSEQQTHVFNHLDVLQLPKIHTFKTKYIHPPNYFFFSILVTASPHTHPVAQSTNFWNHL